MAAQPYDETEILGTDLVIRRVNPDQHVVPDENTGGRRTSSKLFSPSSGPDGGMSIDVLKLIESAGLNAREFVTTPIYTGSVSFMAEAARHAGLRIGYDPVEGNPHHGEVWGGHAKPNSFTRAQRRALVEASSWFVELEGVQIKL